jgi:hypothetical protein
MAYSAPSSIALMTMKFRRAKKAQLRPGRDVSIVVGGSRFYVTVIEVVGNTLICGMHPDVLSFDLDTISVINCRAYREVV